MYEQIKKLADEAIALQNKDRMDAVLRQISCMCSLASSEGAALVGMTGHGPAEPTSHEFTAPGTPNPVVLDGPACEIVAPCPEADAALAEITAVSRAAAEKIAAQTGGVVTTYGDAKLFDTPADAVPAPAHKAKKGGAK